MKKYILLIILLSSCITNVPSENGTKIIYKKKVANNLYLYKAKNKIGMEITFIDTNNIEINEIIIFKNKRWQTK